MSIAPCNGDWEINEGITVHAHVDYHAYEQLTKEGALANWSVSCGQ